MRLKSVIPNSVRRVSTNRCVSNSWKDNSGCWCRWRRVRDDVSVVLTGEVADRFEQGHEGRTRDVNRGTRRCRRNRGRERNRSGEAGPPGLRPPGPVGADEITEQAAAGRSRSHRTIGSRWLMSVITNGWLTSVRLLSALSRVVGRSAIPGGTNIPETDNLEVADEIRLDRTVEQVTENRHAHFAVDHDEWISIPDILLESPHVRSQRLVIVVLGKSRLAYRKLKRGVIQLSVPWGNESDAPSPNDVPPATRIWPRWSPGGAFDKCRTSPPSNEHARYRGIHLPPVFPERTSSRVPLYRLGPVGSRIVETYSILVAQLSDWLG